MHSNILFTLKGLLVTSLSASLVSAFLLPTQNGRLLDAFQQPHISTNGKSHGKHRSTLFDARFSEIASQDVSSGISVHEPTFEFSSQEHKLTDAEAKAASSPALSLQQAAPVTAWTVHTMAEMPGYSLRVKENSKLCDPDVEQIVGYIDVAGSSSAKEKHFFFWFFESRSNPKSDPFILWLNGGPGCSSLTGLFMELGPCRVNPGGNGTTHNPYSWNKQANIVFLDEPVNAGFSYTDGEAVSTTDDAADDVYAFLQLFFSKYDKYSKLDFHVTGESYAGHYIPAIATKIVAENDLVVATATRYPKSEKLIINLQALAIGNGLTDPLAQYPKYVDMLMDPTYGPLMSQPEIDEIAGKMSTCTGLINACYQWDTPFTCVPAAVYCNNAILNPFMKTGLNIYDVRSKCDRDANPLCYEILNDMDAYLNQPEIQSYLGVDRSFQGCNTDVNMKFMMAGDWMKPYVREIAPLLERGIRIAVYAGDADFICNWLGNKEWVLSLEWSDGDDFRAAQDIEFSSKTTKKPAGKYRTYGGLTFIQFYGAGHMVPYDQPENALDFINDWTKSQK